MREPLYLDHNATTPLCQEAQDTLFKYAPLALNAGSAHQMGRLASGLLRTSIQTFAQFLGVSENQILITSSATEAINTYLWSFHTKKPMRILACVTEHSAVLEPLKRLQKLGWQIQWISVDASGTIDLEALKSKLNSEVGLMAFMAANNETGVRHPIEAIASLAQAYAIPLLVDAVAAAAKGPLPLHPGISAMAISPHKFHGPAGVGILAHRPPLQPLIVGGGQQTGKRSGTLNVSLVVSAAAALQAYIEKAPSIHLHLESLQNRFEQALEKTVGAQVNGRAPRMANVSNLYFEGIDGETLLIQLDQAGLLASHGSACQAGAREPSHVIIAMHSMNRARSSLRFSFSREQTLEEIDRAIEIVTATIHKQRSMFA